MNRKLETRANNLFVIGTVLIVVFSLMIGVLNIAVLYLFGLPLVGLIAGVLCVWFSNARAVTKAFLTIVPLALIPLTFVLLYFVLLPTTKETILIRSDFRGPFIIAFSKACGTSISVEPRRRLYQIPADGILIVNEPIAEGHISREFYLEADGSRTPIPEYLYHDYAEEISQWRYLLIEKPSPDSVGVFWAYTSDFSFVVADFSGIKNEKWRNDYKDLRSEMERRSSACGR